MTKTAMPGFSPCNNATLRRAARKLSRFYDDVIAPSGLKGTQYGLLYQIYVGSEPAMGTIAEEMVMDLSALGHTLKPLIRDGYINATVGQQPYLQGYMPVMYAYQRVVLGAPKLELPGGNYFMANEIVTKENVDTFLVREARFRS